MRAHTSELYVLSLLPEEFSDEAGETSVSSVGTARDCKLPHSRFCTCTAGIVREFCRAPTQPPPPKKNTTALIQ